MAGPISLLAVNHFTSSPSRPSSRRSSRHHRSPGRNAVEDDDVDEDRCSGSEHDDEEEDELEEMWEDNERAWNKVELEKKRLSEAVLRDRSPGPSRSRTPQLSRAEVSDEIVPAPFVKYTGTDSSSPSSADEKLSSSDPEKGSLFTGDALPTLADPEVRRPSRKSITGLSATKTKKATQKAREHTARTWRNFRLLLSESWDKRHDPQFKGFWSAVWDFIVGKRESAEHGPKEGDPDYMPPKYRWTPILSGLLQPFAILLEIPGLTEHWYVRLDRSTNEPVAYQDNPIILDVGLAISIACAIIANLALISRFLERRVFTSTILCIVMLSIHDIINIITVGIFGVIHGVDDGFDYSQAFWLCVCSTTASFFTNCTLIYDLIKTKDFRRSGSGLTIKQRNLVIITMILLMYIAVGALCFNFLIPDIHFQSALYYTIVTIETIGFGDFAPSTIGAKIFLFFYVPIGILNLAVAVGTARDTLVESWNSAYRRRRHEVLRKHRERKRQREDEAIRQAAIARRIKAIGAPVYEDGHGSKAIGGGRGGNRANRMKLNVGALTDDQLKEAELEAEDEIQKKTGHSHGTSIMQNPADTNGTDGMSDGKRDVLAEAKRMQEDLARQAIHNEEAYRELQEHMAKEEKMENAIKFGFAFSLFLVFWLSGATVFWKTEGWDWFIAFYFCFVTFTTIGYGDFSPSSPAGRAFFMIWAIAGVATVTLLIAVVAEAYSNRYKSVISHKGKPGDIRHKLRAWAHHGVEWRSDHHNGDHEGEDEQEEDGGSKRDQKLGRWQEGRHQMDKLPFEILDSLSKLHMHVNTIRQQEIEKSAPQAEKSEKDGLADSFKQLLIEYMDEHQMSDLEKREVLADKDMRTAVFWRAYEHNLHHLIKLASLSAHSHQRTMSNLDTLNSTSPLLPNYLRGNGLTRIITRQSTLRSPSIYSSPLKIRTDFDGNGNILHTHDEFDEDSNRLGLNEIGWTSQPDLVSSVRRRKSFG